MKNAHIFQWVYSHHYSYLCELFIELGPCDLIYIHMHKSHRFHPEGLSGE